VDVIASLIANSEPSKLVQPGDGSFHYPTMFAEATTVFRVSTSQVGSDATPAKLVAVRLGVVPSIALDAFGTATWAAQFAADGSDGFNQRQKLGYVVRIGARECRGQWNARRIRNDMVLAARLAAIRGVGAGFCPPSTARTLELSTTARDQSIWSAALSRASSNSCKRFQTPASCQSLSRRQQVIPLPQPNSCGNIAQGIPLRSTNKMPVNASRLPIGGRPPLGEILIGGSSGSATFHRSSDSNGLAMGSSWKRRVEKPHQGNYTAK
jgi:hypothetical protein